MYSLDHAERPHPSNQLSFMLSNWYSSGVIRSSQFSSHSHSFKFLQPYVMSQSILTGYIRPGNPRRLAQKTCPGGRDLTFESWPGAGNSTRTGILWKMKLKLKKKIAWIKFLQVKTKKKQVEFLTFFEVFNGIFPGLWVNFFVLLSHIPYKKSEELPLPCLFDFSLGYCYPHILFA